MVFSEYSVEDVVQDLHFSSGPLVVIVNFQSHSHVLCFVFISFARLGLLLKFSHSLSMATQSTA